MQYTKLGSTGLQVSRICLGTMTFGLQTEETNARRILDGAAAQGVTFLDTADVYPLGKSGMSEQYLGEALGERRKDVVVATKFGSPRKRAIQRR